MNEHFMFPIVGMLRGMAARGNLKDPHAKILGAVGLADDHPGRDALGRAVVEMSRLDVGVLDELHEVSSLDSFLCNCPFDASSSKGMDGSGAGQVFSRIHRPFGDEVFLPNPKRDPFAGNY